MKAPSQALLLAQSALVQFPRNPILLGFSVMPVLIMYLVFGGLFEGVAQLPGFPTDNYLTTPTSVGAVMISFLVIAALGAVALPLTARNYRSAYS
jgi:hypothetical protein